MTRQRRLIIAVLALSAFRVSAQPKPIFEVASIKKLAQPVTGGPFRPTPPIRGGTVMLRNSTVASLIQFAYGIKDFQIVGGPDWMRKDLFEVQAKAAGEPSREDALLMLQSLLEDRFGLRMHKEQREIRFFAMVLATNRPGPYLHRGPDTGPCNREETEALEKARPKPVTGYSVAGISCGALSGLADVASRIAELPVFDRTGLSGRWTATVYFAPNQPVPDADPNLASLPVALQEQLGLKLEPTRGPVEVMVVDSVRQPTEN